MQAHEIDNEFEVLHLPGGGTAWRGKLPAPLLGTDASTCRALFAALWGRRTEQRLSGFAGARPRSPGGNRRTGRISAFSTRPRLLYRCLRSCHRF